jgi:hypothetical protein
LLTALVALLAAAGSLIDKLRDSIPWLALVRRPYLLTAAVFFLIVTFLLQRKRLIRRSEIVEPDALVLKPGKHLIGREEDIDNVLSLLGSNPLVWLIGESGSGKSSLLQSGVVKALATDSTRLVIYVNSWGSDWVQGPSQALLDAFWRVWGQAMPQEKQIGFALSNLFETLARFRQDTGRLPILLFDQFDDYQVRHRSKFVSARRSLMSPKALVQGNAYWSGIDDLVRQSLVHCLFVTRDDTSYGLECVRFLPPEIYHLDRLRRGYALPLLEKLTARSVISNPEAGWQQLCQNICSDLESDGSLLPIQMRVAFRSIVDLRPLTTGEYRRQGGLKGLEASHINHYISETARFSGLSTVDIQRILLAMVDTESGKTIPQSSEHLLSLLPETKRDKPRLERILENFADKQIVRERIDADTRAANWLLDHDYLCRGIVELDRRASYWAYLLKDALAAFESAHGPRATWNALLGPWIQLQLLWQRCRNRLRYGPARRFALLSTVKIALSVPVLLLVAGSYGLSYIHTQREANRLFGEMGLDESFRLTPQEARTLWELSRSDYAVKREVLYVAISQPGTTHRLLRREDYLIHAIVGLNFSTRDRLARDVLPSCYRSIETQWTTRITGCERLAVHLKTGSFDPADLIAEALTRTTEKGFREVDQDLLTLDGNLTAVGARTVFSRVLTAMEKASDAQELQQLAVALAVSASRLDASNARVAFPRVLAMMKKSTLDFYLMSQLGRCLGILSGELSPSDAREAFSQVLELLRNSSYVPYTLNELEDSLTTIGGQLERSYAQGAFSEELETIVATKDPQKLNQLDHGLGGIVHKLSGSDARLDYYRLLQVNENRSSPDAWRGSPEVLGALVAKLESPENQFATGQVLRLINSTSDPHVLHRLALALPFFPRKATESDAQAVCAQVLKAMKNTADREEWQLLAEALAGLHCTLSDADARAATAQLVQKIKETSNTEILNGLVKALAAFPGRLSESDTNVIVNKLLERLKEERDISPLSDLAEALGAFAEKMSEHDRREATGQVLQVMQDPHLVVGLGELAETLGAFPERLSDSDGKIVLSLLLKAIEKSPIEEVRQPLATGLGAVAKRLPTPQKDAFTVLREAIVGLPNPPCSAFLPLLGTEDLDRVVEILKWPTCTVDDRNRLIERIGQIEGQDFENEIASQVDASFVADTWSFANWARSKGFDISTPPTISTHHK